MPTHTLKCPSCDKKFTTTSADYQKLSNGSIVAVAPCPKCGVLRMVFAKHDDVPASKRGSLKLWKSSGTGKSRKSSRKSSKRGGSKRRGSRRGKSSK